MSGPALACLQGLIYVLNLMVNIHSPTKSNRTLCATCAISVTSGNATWSIKDIQKYTLTSHLLICNKIYYLKKFIVTSVCFHVALPLVPLMAQVAQIV